jgi:6-phosphogluconolactonase (cycloisomerase 2 family)
MSATVLTSHRSRLRAMSLVAMLAIAPLGYFSACSSGDDNGGGGGGTPPPGGGGPSTANQFAYVINASDSEIRAYGFDADGNLAPLINTLSTGLVPHHVNVDPQGKFVYVSNHESPFVSGYRLNADGSMVPMVPAINGSPVTGSDPSENQPHWSALDTTRQFLYVVSGHAAPSTLRAYSVDQTTGLLTFIAGQSFPVGNHAHNVVVSPNNQFVYVASEGSGDVHAFSRNTSTGALTSVGSVSGLNGAAAVAVDPATKFAYVSYFNSVEVFNIGANGALTRITPTSTFATGNAPHSLAMHPNGQFLYAANLNTSTVTVFRVDPNSGALTDIQTPSPATGTDPNFVTVHPNQKWLYTSDNVADVTSRYILNADGTLGARTTTATGNGAQGIGITNFP